MQPTQRGARPRHVAGFDLFYCPFTVGLKLWVKETWGAFETSRGDMPGTVECDFIEGPFDRTKQKIHIAYRADDGWEDCGPWRPSIFMPRWASRITLEITSVRVERVQSITEADAKAEGAPAQFVMDAAAFVSGGAIPPSTHRNGFESLWREINGKESWDANPYVWVIEFKRIKGE